MLTKSLPEANLRNLTGHCYVENVSCLDEGQVRAIDRELSEVVAGEYGLDPAPGSKDSADRLIRVGEIGKAIIERGTRDPGKRQDQLVIAHGLSFLLGERLVRVLSLEVNRLGHSFTVPKMIRSLANAQQVVNTFHLRHKVRRTYCFSRLRGLAREYCDKYDLRRYALP